MNHSSNVSWRPEQVNSVFNAAEAKMMMMHLDPDYCDCSCKQKITSVFVVYGALLSIASVALSLFFINKLVFKHSGAIFLNIPVSRWCEMKIKEWYQAITPPVRSSISPLAGSHCRNKSRLLSTFQLLNMKQIFSWSNHSPEVESPGTKGLGDGGWRRGGVFPFDFTWSAPSVWSLMCCSLVLRIGCSVTCFQKKRGVEVESSELRSKPSLYVSRSQWPIHDLWVVHHFVKYHDLWSGGELDEKLSTTLIFTIYVATAGSWLA